MTVLANSTRFFKEEETQWEFVGEGVQRQIVGFDDEYAKGQLLLSQTSH